jgi:hypothetical protein
MVARLDRTVPSPSIERLTSSMDRLNSIHVPIRTPGQNYSSKLQSMADQRQTSIPTSLTRPRYSSSPSSRIPTGVAARPLTRGSPRATPPKTIDKDGDGSFFEEIHGEATCDYDKGATTLYELLESSNWEKARARCRSHPEEVRTWIVRKDRSLKVRWKLLPLHAAIIFQSPNFIVSTLLEKYPSATSRRDDQGMLPLHLAFRHKQDDEELLEILLTQYPKAVHIKDKRDRIPIEHARDSKFSVKVMKLYANAMVAGSVNTTSIVKTDSPVGTRTTVDSSQHAGSALQDHHIQRLEAEHEGRIAVMRAEMKADCERLIESEIQHVQEKYEDRIAALEERNAKTLDQYVLEAQEEREELLNKCNNEIAELRALLTSQDRKDRVMRDTLENEVTSLHTQLQQVRQKYEVTNDKYMQLKEHATEIHEVLAYVGEEHAQLQDIVLQQQEEIHSARTVRLDLLNRLLDHEQSNGEAARHREGEFSDFSSKIRTKIDIALNRGEQTLTESFIEEEQPIRFQRHRDPSEDERVYTFDARPRQTSKQDGFFRMEEAQRGMRHNESERHEGRDDRMQRERLGVIDHARDVTLNSIYQNDEVGIEVSKGKNKDRVSPSNNNGVANHSDDKVLGDEISAITDGSDF